LHPGCIIPGPSIVTEFDSTTVILDGYVAEIDRYFNLLIRKA
jgi:N-methylhydantoinase A